MKVTATLKGRADDHGKRTVYIRVNDGNDRTFKATNIRVTSKQFEKGKVKDHPQASFYNTTIKKKIVETEASLLNGGERTEFANMTLFNYCQHCAEYWRTSKEKSERTLLKEQSRTDSQGVPHKSS